ncbi:MAG TPA: cell surface protein SprA [Bacteroidales bacterium]|nr:cell surface protein SprA [Bacteroidales bacterium]HPB24368.1 cell surface protein SprA [Bacteroidales bacterium]HPI29035.1 cell surface protein SprA [Bacteroidales bacterium]HQN15289.1 cell surface protein SprA [Bacteroidales bacterium]HQP14656.1 cell surface protein SprA [Bacteroidales bacterium]
MKLARYIFQIFAAAFILSIAIAGSVSMAPDYKFISDRAAAPPDTNPPDTNPLPYPFGDNSGNPYDNDQNGGLYLNNPSNITPGVEYDPETNSYILTNKIGALDYRQSNYMSFDEYRQFDMEKAMRDYWQTKTGASRGTKGDGNIIPKIHIGGKAFNKIFGGNTIDIRPSGSAELIFGVVSTKTNNPALDVKQRRTTNFDFQEKIQMNVTAKIGDKIQFGVNYNTESSFDFENKMNLKYEGEEDDIIQLIEGGDVTLPLNSTLITGSQSLFGIKAKLKFGRLSVTGLWSQQESETENITVAGGAQTSEFNVKADQYEENRHFFLSQYFRDHYEEGLKKLPIVTSNINITNLEVWLTNIGSATTENRNIVAFQDLGEGQIISNTNIVSTGYYPANDANTLFSFVDEAQLRNLNGVNNYLASLGMTAGLDYEKVELARKLQPSEYTFNNKLGFISLNTSLNSDQVLAVAFQYTLVGDTTVYQVGELTNTGVSAPSCLLVKLIKSTTLSTKVPMYKLMMKNVYSIGGYQINSEDFRLNVLYSGEEQGIPMGYITEGAVNGIPLIRVMGCDRLDLNQNPIPDGVFDFVGEAATQGGLIQASNGRIFFPVLEPFGSNLRKAITGGNPSLNSIADKYCYDSLYTMTKTGAQQYPDRNKFALQGTYKSAAGAEISLGAMSVPQGSVKVTAGGIPLTENVDYTVDYTMGRVKIINEGILNSGTPINISLENNSTFSIQTKTLMGLRFDYMINKNFNVGGTVLNLTEKPLTQKVNFGDEPISNTIWGIDGAYTTEARWLTKLVDMIPLINTKAVSNLSINAEFANLIPGHSRAIGKTGTSYIDDFESSKSTIDLKNVGSWFIASTPQNQLDMFPEANPNSGLGFNYNRAKLAWYVIDPSVFYRNNNQLPPNITNDDISNHLVREVYEQEVFPNRQPANNLPSNIAILNLAYYPKERGPYNYDVDGSEGFSLGTNPDGSLIGPDSRWGGMMRRIESTDFEETNIEYIEFWMMDPFVYNPSGTGGQIYIDLGDVSEDVLRDSRKSVENGLPPDGVMEDVDTTIWGIVPSLQPLTNSFDNNESARPYQDVGLDGLANDNENLFFSDYINRIVAYHGAASGAYQKALSDPSADDFHYFRGPDYDTEQKSILQRYKNYNGTDGNSPTDQQTQDEYGVNYPMQSTTIPDGEDINRDNTLSEGERYFQYHIDLSPSKMVIGQNYISDILDASTGRLPNGTSTTIKWYQFKVPVQSPDKIIGGIQDFKSIRFIRVFFRGFTDSVVCRFATFDLVRGDWRRYNYSLLSPGEYVPNDEQMLTTFDVSAVNLEENGQRSPVTYVVPPGIEREINYQSTTMQQLNEQALSMKICNIMDGDARAVYKTCDFDMRKFKTLKMFIHAEAMGNESALQDGELTAFIRLGSDFKNNFYEYEVPLALTPWYNSDPNVIWPEQNRIEITLDELVDAKQLRNTLLHDGGNSVSSSLPFITYDSKNNKITVMGNPSISDVKVIMLGIRNPKKGSANPSDDGKDKCAEIWFNELRLTDFDQSGGYAATGRIAANLADFGNVSLAGTISTPGFGSIDKKLNQLQKETIISYDIATNLELGKFFPEKWGVKIPMHFDYSEMRTVPEYNPLNPDVIYREDLKTYSKTARDSVRKITQDVTTRKSLNFMNVRKTKVGASTKNHIYDLENFDFTYAFTELFHRNVDIEYDRRVTHMGGLGYNYSANPKIVKPLDKWKLISKSKWLRIIKDFNFYYMPKLLSFRTDLNKQFQENLMRNKTNAIIILEPAYVKRFGWTRDYALKWDLTQNLKLDYQAHAIALIDEPPGKIEKGQPNFKQNRDSIWENVLNFGRMTNYNQNIDINYTLPINKIPAFNWMNISARYGGAYSWTALPLSTDSLDNIIENPLGNVIENSNSEQLNLTANLTNLYNKVKYLKKINDKRRGGGSSKPQIKTNMPGENPDSLKPKINIGKEILDNTLSLLMLVKTVNISYQESNGRLLPGFMHKPVALGMDWKHKAPTAGFVFGSPGDMFASTGDILGKAFQNNWITADTSLNTPFSVKQSKVLNYQASLEPLNGMRIDVTGNTNYAKQNQAFYRYDMDGENNHSEPFSLVETGNFSMTIIGMKTAFIADNKDNSNDVFQKFKDYRIIIATRLAAQNPNSTQQIVDSTGFPDGYGPTSQDVLIPAFLAAYLGKSPDNISLTPFSEQILKAIPLPNWRLTYNGLTKIGFIKKYFRTVTLSHTYRCTYNVSSFATNVRYKEGEDGFSFIRDQIGNFIAEKEIGQISITEQFSPLVGLDLTMINSLLVKFEWKKSRNLSLSFANNQLTEVASNEYVVGAGYRFKDVSFNLNLGGKRRHIKSDLNLKADFSVRQNKTTLRKLVENMDQVSAGGQIISIGVSADYQISEKFNVRLFYDHIINNPYVSSQYPNSNINGGLSLRFTLAQ